MTENWTSLPNTTVINKRIADFKRLQNCGVSMLNATITRCAKKIENIPTDTVTKFDVKQTDALKLMKATSLTVKT